MKFKEAIPVTWIAEFLGARLVGNRDQQVTGINEIHKVEKGDISFVDYEKYYKTSLASAATVILVDQLMDCPPGKTLLVVDDPFSAYVRLCGHFSPFQPASGFRAKDLILGEGTLIQPGVFIGNDVQIGRNCLIHSQVSLYDGTRIGDEVIIHAGTIIGADAFYFKRRKGHAVQYEKMHSVGRVIIEDQVEIGAACTIDRGVSGDTRIGRGTKLDNQVHVGHGVEIGRNCLIAAQVGIGGKTIIEDEVILWGQVGVSKDLRIGAGAIVYAQSGVAQSLAPGRTYFGSPAQDARTQMREQHWIKRIPELWAELKAGRSPWPGRDFREE